MRLISESSNGEGKAVSVFHCDNGNYVVRLYHEGKLVSEQTLDRSIHYINSMTENYLGNLSSFSFLSETEPTQKNSIITE